MRNVIRFPRDQQLLLPVDMTEWLSEDDPVFFIMDIISNLDLHEMYEVYREDGMGGAFFDPEVMLGIILYAYSRGEYSTRRIERACRYDVGFRVISRNLTPDHTTISRFLKRFKDQIPSIAQQVTQLLHEAGIIRIGILAIDGTKIKANAALSANKTGTYLEEQITQSIERTMEIDAWEDREYGVDTLGDELPVHLRTHKQRREQLKNALERLKNRQAEEVHAYKERIEEREREEQETGKKRRGRKPKPPGDTRQLSERINTTDPDSAVMKNHQGFFQGYNGQVLVNEDQYILSFDLTNAQNDVHQLHPLVSRFMDSLGTGFPQQPHWIIGDAGYYSYENVVSGSPQCPDLVLATRRERDCFPHSHADESLLLIEGIWRSLCRGDTPCYSLLRAAARWIMDTLWWIDEDCISPPACVRLIMEARVRSPAGSEIYRKRKVMVEPVFGRMKEFLRFRQFHHRGIELCKAEFALVCSTLNVLKAKSQWGTLKLKEKIRHLVGRGTWNYPGFGMRRTGGQLLFGLPVISCSHSGFCL